MTAAGELPYEECARQREQVPPRDRAVDTWPAYALPPFRLAPPLVRCVVPRVVPGAGWPTVRP